MKPSQQSQPNILILFTDQHKASVLGYENHPDVRTPNLDKLAARGTHFSRAYSQDAICMPSRCSIFSGLYPRTSNIFNNESDTSALKNAVSMQSVFKNAGYVTAAFGKRHLHEGADKGWDIVASHHVKESPNDNYVHWIGKQGYAHEYNMDWAAEFGRGAEQTSFHNEELPFAFLSVRESYLPKGMTMEGWTKSRTVEFLKQQTASDRPFFCFSSYYRPHQPLTPLPEYYARFDRSHWGKGRNAGDGIAMPPSLRQPVNELPPLFQDQSSGTNRIWRFDLARKYEQLYRDCLAAYYALVEEIDDHIGEILKTLEETGQLENTIILYTSDHGDFVGAHGMAEKCAMGHNVYEDTLRVPLIVGGPKVIGKATHDGLVELIDIYPTLLELAGIEIPTLEQPLQGQSLAHLLQTGEGTGKKYIVSENRSQATVITDRYKLGVWKKLPESDPFDYTSFGDMLFDREEDPYEIHNRAGDPTLNDIERHLRGLLEAWTKRFDASSKP